MKLYFKRGVVIGFIITILTMGGLGIYSYISMRQLVQGGDVQSHSLRVTNYAERVLITTIDLETGQRGFLITNDSIYLEPYAAALKSIDDNIQLLMSATDGRATRPFVEELRRLVMKKAVVVTRTIQARARSFEESRALVMTGEGKHIMDQIRKVVNDIHEHERKIYDGETAISAHRLAIFQYAFAGALMVPAAIVVVLFYSINQNLTRREEASIKLQRANQEIMQLNKDLESFTYSVSHDLRSPLRSVNGYANVLIEDYGAQLDADARRTVETIARNGRRMGQLIDDLLDFSRLGRKELQRTTIQMNEVVSSVIIEIRESLSTNAKIDLHDLPDTTGDINMMRQVWHNLIANALKYSAKKGNPVVEIGSFRRDEWQVYYVKDNGVGFNMQYAGKLFGVFQRLHKAGDFEGTGVGLALVKRIIERHGGRVWAEGVVDQGATFYFQLLR